MRQPAPDHHPVNRLATRALAATLLTAAAAACPLSALADAPAHTRVLAWTGGERLSVDVAAEVDYVAGPNARVVITGPADQIDDIVVEDGVIRNRDTGWGWFGGWSLLGRRGWGGPPIHIVVTAPHLSAVSVQGSGHVNLGRLAQDRLDLSVSGSGGASASGAIRTLKLWVSGSGGARLTALTTADMAANLTGSGWVSAAGAADSLRLSISGSGHVDLAALTLQDVSAGLSGSGSASLAPKRSADLGVSGSGR